jgi:hypothetical protein
MAINEQDSADVENRIMDLEEALISPKARRRDWSFSASAIRCTLLAPRYLVMYQQRSVSTVRQRFMGTAVTFAAVTESWSAITTTSQSRHHGRPGDGYHGHAL